MIGETRSDRVSIDSASAVRCDARFDGGDGRMGEWEESWGRKGRGR